MQHPSDNASTIALLNIKAPKNGYCFFYLSNESGERVFFDNLQVRHDRGRIIEENHYYAYGLKIAAISSKAFGAPNNNYLYQGDFNEFDDDLGWSDFALRSYDAQIGRFLQNDPYDQFASGYVGMGNDPVNNIDEDGGMSFVPAAGSFSMFGSVKELPNVVAKGTRVVKKTTSLWSITKAFANGVVGSLAGTVNGVVDLVTDPLGAVKNIVHAVANPSETWNGIKESAIETWNTIKSGDPEKIAELAGNLAGNLLTGGVVGKGLSTAGKFAKMGKLGKTVQKIARKIPCGCFLAGTLVFTDTGEKAIENIKIGDKVWAYNDTTGDYALKKVVALHRYLRDSVYNISIGEETIQATADHPFFISGQWLRVAELKVGDSVKTYDGSNLVIEQITGVPGQTTVYNFEVEDYHTYYVTNTKVLVHNSGPCPDGGWKLDRRGKIKDGPEFGDLEDHAKRHKDIGGGDPVSYYNSAVMHISNSKYKFKVTNDGQTKYAHVTPTSDGDFIFTSTNKSGNRIFTHLKVDAKYLSNKGITLPQ